MHRDSLFRAVVESLPIGALIADSHGRIIFANAAATGLLARGIYTRDAARLADHLRFRAARNGVERLVCGDDFLHGAFMNFGTITVVVLYTAAVDPQRLSTVLGESYGLTPQERRIAIALYQGQSLRLAARSLDIELSTARSHLKNIFMKTRTRRQSTLALLIASCAAAAATAQPVPLAGEDEALST